MKTNSSIRVRFAPSPTGMMHLGNVRTALMNYLFARKYQGSFIVRIEDTDRDRIFDPKAQKIQKDLAWLGLVYDEGPQKPSSYGPFFQSQRDHFYKQKLQKLIDNNLVYRCFCTQNELETKRKRQIALKLPPRYDRTCAGLSQEEINDKLEKTIPFIWRMKLDLWSTCSIEDLGRGTVMFNMKHFSDFPITRQDGSITFMFANFVDDMLMNISHVLRGEDHLTNTAGQAVLYKAFKKPLPLFWHMPILCNTEGKKLSKRDFGFALQDLKRAGYLPEAILNYLALIGGGSFEKEIMSLEELVSTIDFNQMHSGGQVKYDLEKLNWINKKWIERLDIDTLIDAALPFIEPKHHAIKTLDRNTLRTLISFVRNEAITLNDFSSLLRFYFETPNISFQDIQTYIPEIYIAPLTNIIRTNLEQCKKPQLFVSSIKEQAKACDIPIKYLMAFVRLCLMGSKQGPSVTEIIALLGSNETKKRIEQILA